jgi:L-asparaginase
VPVDLIEASVSLGAKGLVVAGMGNGNPTAPAAAALAEVAKRGVVVVRSSRVVSGDVTRNVEVDDDALGFVAADQLNPPKARVLLELCLTRTSDLAAIQDAFYRY